jgi:hypothetical protein
VVPATRKATGDLKRRNMITVKGVDRAVQSLPRPAVEIDGVSVENATIAFSEPISPEPQSKVKNTTIGVDPTVASEDELNFMKNSIRASAKVNSIPPDRVQALNVKLTEKELGHMAGVENLQIPAPTASPKINFRETTVIGHGVFVENLRTLLTSVLRTVDASIPNKDQNRAVKHILRKEFDAAYISVMESVYPGGKELPIDGEYFVLPH